MGARFRQLLTIVSIASASALLVGVQAPSAETSAALPLQERELTGSGGWSWFGDPRAVFHQGIYRRTYTGWVAQDGSIQVASYDHDSGQRVVVTLKARLQIDDHDNPSILVRPDGRLMVFWSTHNGPQMSYRLSVKREDITAWQPERVLPTNTTGSWGFTYPNPMQLPAEGNRIYLFWRGGNFNPTMSTSLDGSSWTPARTVISNPGERPYVKYASNRDTIAMAFTQAHPRSGGTDIYYAAYRAGSLRHANGSVIAPISGPAITPAQADKVYNHTTNGKAWVHDVAFDAAGRPVIVYATFPTDTDHRYRYARWNGTRWIDRELTRAGRTMSISPAEPNYSGGITLDHDNPSVVYLSRQINGIFEIEAWTTPDSGASWSSRALTRPSVRNNYRPVAPRGQAGDDLGVMWMHGTYPGYTAFRTGVRGQIRTREIADPTAVASRPDRLDVFARDRQTSVLLQKYSSGGWSGWTAVGGGPAGHPLGAPTTTSWGAGRMDVFAVDQVTGHLVQRSYDGGWSGWIDRGLGPSGHGLAAPAAVSWASGRTDVVVRDTTNGDLLHFWQSDTTWFGPERVAAGVGGAYVPSIASWGPGRLDVFTVRPDGQLVQLYFNGTGWHGWERQGSGPGGAPLIQPAAVTAWGPGRLDVFALVTGGRDVAHLWYDAGAWRGLQGLGTGPDRITYAGLTATSSAYRRLDVFSTDKVRHDLVQLSFNGTGWLGPVPQDFNTSPVSGTTTLMLDPNPRATPIPVSPDAEAAD